MKNSARTFTNADGAFVPSRYIRGIIVYGVNLVYPEVPAANYRAMIVFRSRRYRRAIHSEKAPLENRETRPMYS